MITDEDYFSFVLKFSPIWNYWLLCAVSILFSHSHGFPRPVCRLEMVAPHFSCSSPSSSSLLCVLIGAGGKLVVESDHKKKKKFPQLLCHFCSVDFWKLCLQSCLGKPVRPDKPLWYQIYQTYDYFCFFFSVVAPEQPIWQFLLDPNLLYPSWLWGLSAVNIDKRTTCRPASMSMMHIKWVLTWELFLLYWKCQSLLPVQLLEVYWQSCTHGSLSASHSLSMHDH